MSVLINSDVDIAVPKRRKEEADLDITPMIDVTFLLLAFFVVVSKMDQNPPIVMPNSNNGVEISPDKTVIILVADEDGAAGSKMYKGNSDDSAMEIMGDDDAKLQQLAAYIESEIAKRPEIIGILVKSGKKVRYKHLKLISEAAGKTGGGRKIYFGTEKE